MKRQPSDSEKLVANEASDKELISKIYKQFLQLNSRKISDPNKQTKKWARELNKHFSKYFFGRTSAEAEAPILLPPDAKSQLTGKDPEKD